MVTQDFRDFLDIVSKQRNGGGSVDELWNSIFGKVTSPGSLTLAKNAQKVTKLNDYNAVQFSVRPIDMKYAFTQEKLNTTAVQLMCEMMSTMQERIENIEASMTRPSDDSVCVENAVKSAPAPLAAKVNQAPSTNTATESSTE